MGKTIILVVFDSLRYDVFYRYLNKRDSGFLSNLQNSSIEFKGATATAPWSLPSHASIFTGKYPREHGALRFNTRIPNDMTTLLDQLNKEGFRTACFSSNEFVKPEYGLKGWDYRPDHYGQSLFADAPSPISDEEGLPKVIDAASQIARSHKPFKSFLNAIHSQARRAPALVDDGGKPMTEDACTWLENCSDRDDLFLFFNYMETHVLHKKLSSLRNKIWNLKNHKRIHRLQSKMRNKNLHPDETLLAKEDIQLYYEIIADELQYLDRLLSKLYSKLIETDRVDDCLFLLCSDHGDGLGEQGYIYHDFGGLSEPLIRVPLFISHPHTEPETIDKRVSLSWIYSTILGFIGQKNGPDLRDRKSYPELVGAENTGHVLDIVDSPVEVPDYYLKDRLAVYQTRDPNWKYMKAGDEYSIWEIEKNSLIEKRGKPTSDKSDAECVIGAFEERYTTTKVEKFDLNKRTKRRLHDLGYI